MNIEKELHRKREEEYGENYRAHYLEIYRLYVEMADKISERRQSANSFFLTVNTAIVAIVSYVQLGADAGMQKDFYGIVSLAGMTLCYMWYRLIRSYKDMNTGKFKVIHQIEQNLPLAPYDAEWEALGRGEDRKLYWPFTHIEKNVPWVFFFLHGIVFLRAAILWVI